MASAAAPVSPDVVGPPPSLVAGGEETPFRLVPWASCDPSSLNPRKFFDPEGLKELAGTMSSDVGVIEPLVVRPAKAKHRYEIIAGERRWRAADLAGLKEVPVIVRQLTDVQALRIMVIENAQRRDLNALEQGEGFYQLTKRGVDIDAIAADIRLSRKYVYDRIKLRDLVSTGKELLADGRITAGHAILIARLSEKEQRRVLEPPDPTDNEYHAPLFRREGGLQTFEEEDAEERAAMKDPYVGMKTVTVRELDGWIAEHCRFDPKAAVSRELFPETARAVETAEKVVQITRNAYTQPDAKDGNTQRIYHDRSWKRADGKYEATWSGKPEKTKACNRSVLGIVVAGPGRGEAFKVCVNKDCDVHWKSERVAREKASKGGAAAQERYRKQQEDQQAKWKAEREKAERERQALMKAKPAVIAAFVSRIKSGHLGAIAGFIMGELNANQQAAVKELGKPATGDDWIRVIALGAVIQFYRDSFFAHRNVPDAAKALGVDLAPLLKSKAKASKKR